MSKFFVEAGEYFSYCPAMTDNEILDAIRDGRSRAWLARALKVPYHAGYQWSRRGRIPKKHRAAVMALKDRRASSD